MSVVGDWLAFGASHKWLLQTETAVFGTSLLAAFSGKRGAFYVQHTFSTCFLCEVLDAKKKRKKYRLVLDVYSFYQHVLTLSYKIKVKVCMNRVIPIAELVFQSISEFK